MSWLRIAALALLSLSVAPTRGVPVEDPLPRGEVWPSGPIAPKWVHRTANLGAVRVRLNSLGARTHANWVLFRLPFDASQTSRLQNIHFHATSRAQTAVGALSIGSLCSRFPSDGGIEAWSLYTVSAVGWSQHYASHPGPPTNDPTILGLNVPTRVANYVACGWDTEHLADPDNWAVEVSWDER